MGVSPSWKVAICSSTQDFRNMLWNTKANYCVHKRLPIASLLSQINPVRAHLSRLSKIHFSIIPHLHVYHSGGHFPSGFYSHSSSSLSSIFHALWSSSLCSFPQTPVISTLFGLNILLNTLFWKPFSQCSSLNVSCQISSSSELLGLHGHPCLSWFGTHHLLWVIPIALIVKTGRRVDSHRLH
jgi:hypothetical protein